jgi:ABC-type glycerol-3-phosphate transport system substrate-binding protein
MSSTQLSRRAFLHLAATTAVGAVFLTACAPVAAPQGAGAGAAAAASAPLVYWNYMTDMEEIESKILDAFKSSNADVALTYEYVPWQQYWEKLNATLAAGNLPMSGTRPRPPIMITFCAISCPTSAM